MRKESLVLPCLRAVMGDWVYYSTVMNAYQINKWVRAAKDIRETKDLDKILQRTLKDRTKAISRYLLNNESRFFNSIIIGVFEGVPDWYEFKFNTDKKFNFSEDDLKSLKDSMGFLEFKGNEDMFAIDGQHRIAGIKIAFGEDSSKSSQVLSDDQFSVIFVAHIDDDGGRKRTRKLFSDINKHAKPVATGDKIIIDEEDLSAIVTRRVYANYKHFKKGTLISLTENAKLEAEDENHFTNLLGLYNVNKELRKLFKKKPKTKDWDEVNVESFYNITINFYDFIIKNIDDYKAFFSDKKLTLKKARKNNEYLLFRPIGLKLVAKLYVYYYQHDIINNLKKDINLISFIFPKSPYNYILWNNGKMEPKTSNQKLAFDLTLYLLNKFPQSEEKGFLKKYREILKDDSIDLPKKLTK